MPQAAPKNVDVEHMGRFAKLYDSVSNTLRSVKLSIQERTAIAQRFINPLPLQSLGYAQMGRAIGRLGAAVVDPRRIHVRQELLVRTTKGKVFFLENLRDSLKVAVKGMVPNDRLREVTNTIDAKFNELIEKTGGENGPKTRKEFMATINRTIAELSKELGISRLPSVARSLAISHFLNMQVLKSGNKVALLDPFANRAYVIDKVTGTEVQDINMTEKEIDELLTSKGIDPAKAPKNLREIEGLRGLLLKLRNEGFKIGEGKLVDIREKVLVGRALAEAISSGKNINIVYNQMLEEDFKVDPEFYRAFQEKATKEIIRSVEAAAMANTMMETFTKLPARFTAMFTRLTATIMRYVPIIGPIVSVGAEATTMFTEYGEVVTDKVKSLSSSVWSLKDLVNDKLGDSSILNNISLFKSIGQEAPVAKEQTLTQTVS
ncbi:MAG: hypothetical protein QXH21_09385 [Ignisphaera sp.]